MPQQSTVIVVIYHGVRRDVEDFSTPRGLQSSRIISTPYLPKHGDCVVVETSYRNCLTLHVVFAVIGLVVLFASIKVAASIEPAVMCAMGSSVNIFICQFSENTEPRRPSLHDGRIFSLRQFMMRGGSVHLVGGENSHDALPASAVSAISIDMEIGGKGKLHNPYAALHSYVKGWRNPEIFDVYMLNERDIWLNVHGRTRLNRNIRSQLMLGSILSDPGLPTSEASSKDSGNGSNNRSTKSPMV